MKQIYLDYNATTPVSSYALEAMLPFLKEHYGNPSSNHAVGRVGHEAVELARGEVAFAIGATADEVCFSSGGTESNNMAIHGVMLQHAPDSGAHLIVSNFEHPAVSAPVEYLQRMGYQITEVPCDENGVVTAQRVAEAMRDTTVLVSIMHSNNEIGTLQPISKISEVCRGQNVLLHTDAAQSVGKVSTQVDEIGVDLMTIAGHKVYAPKGVGALYVRTGVSLDPVLYGAGHERGLRPGTENVPSIVGLGKAMKLAHRSLEESSERLGNLRDRLSDRLLAGLGNQARIHGEQAPRLPGTLSLVFPGVRATDLLARVPEICASTGSACHETGSGMSKTLAALGTTPQDAQGTVRLTVGWYTSEEDVDRAASSLLSAWESLV